MRKWSKEMWESVSVGLGLLWKIKYVDLKFRLRQKEGVLRIHYWLTELRCFIHQGSCDLNYQRISSFRVNTPIQETFLLSRDNINIELYSFSLTPYSSNKIVSAFSTKNTLSTECLNIKKFLNAGEKWNLNSPNLKWKSQGDFSLLILNFQFFVLGSESNVGINESHFFFHI